MNAGEFMNFPRATDGKTAGGGPGWLLLAQSVIYAVAVLMLTGLVPDWGQWYSTSPFRAQTAALLRGELALSSDPGRLEHDLSWSGGGVQQVWGLGIPLWRLPFEAVAMWLGQPGFPDRLALGLFLAVTAWVVLRTFVEPALLTAGRLTGQGPAIVDCPGSGDAPPSLGTGLGGAVVLLGFAPFWSVMRCRGAIYEEVLIYVYLYGLLLACGVVALARRPGWGRFWWLCALAGLGGLIRPTLVFYGMATLLTASAVLALSLGRSLPTGPWLAGDKPRGLRLLRDRRWWTGVAIYLAGGALLWGTNLLRFGDGFEFGHRLNLQDGSLLGSIYATRFDYPFQAEPLWRAGRELLGALFASPKWNGSAWYATEIFAGQSPMVRWREFYFTTYDWSYLLLIAGGWVAGAWVLCRWLKSRANGEGSGRSSQCAPLPELAVLALWSWLVCVPLAAFYLRAPAISSRYLLDFGPAFAVAILVAWCWAAERAERRGRWAWPRAMLWMLLLGWLGWQFGGLEGAYGSWRPVTREELSRRIETPLNPKPPPPLPSAYQAGEDLSQWCIRFNGAGWARDGAVQASLILFVEDPRFLELELSSGPALGRGQEEAEQIRAKVGLELLEQESIERTEEGWRVRFAGPTRARYQSGVQAVFVATVSRDRLADAHTGWVLRRVSWRKERRRTRGRRPI